MQYLRYTKLVSLPFNIPKFENEFIIFYFISCLQVIVKIPLIFIFLKYVVQTIKQRYNKDLSKLVYYYNELHNK